MLLNFSRFFLNLEIVFVGVPSLLPLLKQRWINFKVDAGPLTHNYDHLLEVIISESCHL